MRNIVTLKNIHDYFFMDFRYDFCIELYHEFILDIEYGISGNVPENLKDLLISWSKATDKEELHNKIINYFKE
jgi:hypothetical protein